MRILVISKHSLGTIELTGVKTVGLVHGADGDDYQIVFENTSRESRTYSIAGYFIQILNG